jgi:excisionase family DNA binding protein
MGKRWGKREKKLLNEVYGTTHAENLKPLFKNRSDTAIRQQARKQNLQSGLANPELWTVREAAEAKGLSLERVRGWVRRGLLKSRGVSEFNANLISIDELEALLASMEKKKTKEVEINAPWPWMTVSEACALLGLSKSALNRAIRNGLLDSFKPAREVPQVVNESQVLAAAEYLKQTGNTIVKWGRALHKEVEINAPWPWMTSPEACAFLGLSITVLNRAIRKGYLESFKPARDVHRVVKKSQILAAAEYLRRNKKRFVKWAEIQKIEEEMQSRE